ARGRRADRARRRRRGRDRAARPAAQPRRGGAAAARLRRGGGRGRRTADQNRSVSIVVSVDDEPWPPNRINVSSGSSAAPWLARAFASAGATAQLFVAGLNTSTLAIDTGVSSVPCAPPQIATRPSPSTVAECSV